jgi:hypothetical protein
MGNQITLRSGAEVSPAKNEKVFNAARSDPLTESPSPPQCCSRTPVQDYDGSKGEIMATFDWSDCPLIEIVPGKGRWTLIQPYVAQVVAAVNAATPGSFAEVKIPLK